MRRIWKIFAILIVLVGVFAVTYQVLIPPRRSSAVAVGPKEPINETEAEAIIERARELNSGALLVIRNGEEILGFGDLDQPFDIRSIRKSINNLILAQLVLAGKLDLDASLADLGIDDEAFRLNGAERSATVRELMEARSGVYHLAAREMRSEASYRPDRGAYEPGEFWYYNNWDFNVLESIAAKAAGDEDFCQTFARYVAPLLAISDPGQRCEPQLEEKKSIHAAHKLRLTARELARFAAIYRQDGMAQGERVLPEGWAAWSAEPVSHFDFIDDSKFFYGRLFWSVAPYGSITEQSFMARGAGSQYVWIVPEADLTIIHLVRTRPLYFRKRTNLIPDDNDAWTLGGMVAGAVIDGDLEHDRLY